VVVEDVEDGGRFGQRPKPGNTSIVPTAPDIHAMRLNEHLSKTANANDITLDLRCQYAHDGSPPYHLFYHCTDVHFPALSTNKLLLLPYSAHHVPTYHTWIQDPALQAATASEPLPLDQEYAMQRSWRTDHDKLTFIICRPLPEDHDPSKTLQAGQHDSAEKMVGDINLFLFEQDSEAEEGHPGPAKLVGEIELMIALPLFQRQGYGRAALVTFINYVLSNWPAIAKEYLAGSKSVDAGLPQLDHLRARINQTNLRSIALFENVGFKKTGEKANYFGEVELRWSGPVEEARGFRGWEEPKVLWYRD